MHNLWLDLRYGARNLRKHSLLSITIVVTLTLGIGISTGVFTLINALVLRARVDKDPGSFVRIYSSYTSDRARPGPPGGATIEDYLSFRDGAGTLSDVTGWWEVRPSFEDDPAEVHVILTTGNYFSLYTTQQPKLGRFLQPEDCSASEPVGVLSEWVWRERFASDPQIVGKVVRFNSQPVKVIGIAPTFASQYSRTVAWLPYTAHSYLKLGDAVSKPADARWQIVEARLNAGFSRQQAAAELSGLASQQDQLHPGRMSSVIVTDGSVLQHPDTHNIMVWVISLVMGTLALIVLIACANVTTLLLARSHARQQEIAIRLALGAGKLRLVRMLLIETVLLASVAGLASLYFVFQVPDLLNRWLVIGPFEWPLTPDWLVFAYLANITLLAGAAAGLMPALQSLKTNLSDSLKGRQSMFGAAGGSVRGLLVGTQVTVSFVLVVGTGLFARAYQHMASTDPGFETRQVLATRQWMSSQFATRRSWSAFHRAFAQRVQALPDVQSVAYAIRLPFAPGTALTTEVEFPGQRVRSVTANAVSPGFFETLGVPIISGREFRESDAACGKGSCSVVVSQTLAREFWPSDDPLGKTLRTSQGGFFEVVGVARDTSSLQFGGSDGPLIYMPWAPDAGPYSPILRFTGSGAGLATAITSAIRETAPELEVETRTIQSRIDQSTEGFWKIGVLVAILGGIAVSLAMIGIYGIISIAVSQRTKELGIRIALGAHRKDIFGAVLGSSLRPVIVGLLAGLLLAFAGASALERILRPPQAPFSVNARDFVAYAAATTILAAISFVALVGPARRAAKVDPMVALRYE